jgi:predicted RNA binding protein YcfA (HicA-like mRNA interferase family)
MMRPRKPSGRKDIKPIDPFLLLRVFESVGYVLKAEKGSHKILRHPDKRLNISIPVHAGQEVQPELIHDLIKKAGLSREEYLAILKRL